MLRGATLVVLTVLFVFSANASGEGPVKLLFPSKGVSAGFVNTVVFEAAEGVNVRIDAEPVEPVRVMGGDIYHVTGKQPAGETVEVKLIAADGNVIDTRLGGTVAGSFHDGSEGICYGCHVGGERGCGECHAYEGGEHASLLAKGCSACHLKEAVGSIAVKPLCISCHPKVKKGKHGRSRHAISAESDPKNPDEPLTCVSCHDPHEPIRLGRVDRGELRRWCRECHSK